MRYDAVTQRYVSKQGSIYRVAGRRRLPNELKLVPVSIRLNNAGYVRTSAHGVHYVHRIVWRAFNGEIPNGFEIDHIDGNKLNNALDNLELVTHKENMVRASNNGLIKTGPGSHGPRRQTII